MFGQRLQNSAQSFEVKTTNCTWRIERDARRLEQDNFILLLCSLSDNKMPKVKAAKKTREHGQNKVYQQGMVSILLLIFS